MLDPSRIRIASEAGRPKRVTVEHGVKSLAAVYDLQDRLSAALSDFHPKARHDIHMTLFHFGLPDELYRQMHNINQKLGREMFTSELEILLASTAEVIPDGFGLEVVALAEFGSNDNPALVLKLESPQWLKDARQQIQTHFEAFLESCKVSSIREFMDSSPILHFQLPEHFQPHVTLGHAQGSQSLPSLNVSGLQLVFSPSRLRNVTIV